VAFLVTALCFDLVYLGVAMCWSILVVDDSERWRDALSEVIRAEAHLRVVATAPDGDEAVSKAEEYQPDLVLLDIQMPGLNGIRAAEKIFQVSPKSMIIFVTQNSSPALMEAALNTGALGYILKTNVASELTHAIERVMNGNKFVSGSLVIR
jgi:two-component system nitrate/nitrite response regulator NarL